MSISRTIRSVARKQETIKLNLSKGSVELPDDERWMAFAKVNLPGFPRIVKYKPSPRELQSLIGTEISVQEGDANYDK